MAYNSNKLEKIKREICSNCGGSFQPCSKDPLQVAMCQIDAFEYRMRSGKYNLGGNVANNKLRKDISGLVINGIPVSVENIRKLFINRTDVYSQQDKRNPEKFQDVKEELTDDIILSHLFGDITIGTRSVNPKTGLTKWIAWDIDEKENDSPKDVVTNMGSILKKDYGLNCYVEASGSKNSYHPWIFIEPTNYYDGRLEKWDKKLKEIVESTCSGDVCIDRGVQGVRNMEGTGKGEGCMLKLPFGIQLKNGIRSRFLNCKDLSKIIPQKLEV